MLPYDYTVLISVLCSLFCSDLYYTGCIKKVVPNFGITFYIPKLTKVFVNICLKMLCLASVSPFLFSKKISVFWGSIEISSPNSLHTFLVCYFMCLLKIQFLNLLLQNGGHYKILILNISRSVISTCLAFLK